MAFLCEIEFMKQLKLSELKIGDVISYGPGAYNQMTVINKTEKLVKFFRPYVHLSDFTDTSGVSACIGNEIVIFHITPENEKTTFNWYANIYYGKV